MQKLSGGQLLECGHSQVLSEFRQRIALSGLEQRPVWCIECTDWTRVLPSIEPDQED